MVFRYDNGSDVQSIDIGEGGVRASRFLVLGSMDKQVKILSLDQSNLMVPLSTQLLPDRPASICLTTPMSINEPMRVEIGLANGFLVRSLLDSSGVIIDTRTHVLASRPVRCQRIRLGEETKPLTLCCTSRPWLARSATLTPLRFVCNGVREKQR